MGVSDDLRVLVTHLFGFLAPRHRERQAVLARPLPDLIRRQLHQRYPHYRRLPADVRAEFDRQLQVFMAETRVIPVKARVTGEVRLLTAASAVTLSAGWPGYAWDQVNEVLIYPKPFDSEYRFIEGQQRSDPDRPMHAGQAHAWGIVILSKPSLLESFASSDGAFHVGVHEFAHLLDRARFDGVPSYLSPEHAMAWERLAARESERLRRGQSALDPYGLTHAAELFPVAVEAFFQRPVVLAAEHAELYAFLSTYFNQDPAAWARDFQPL